MPQLACTGAAAASAPLFAHFPAVTLTSVLPQTVFLHVDPTDTVANLKLKLQELLQQARGEAAAARRGVQDRAPLASLHDLTTPRPLPPPAAHVQPAEAQQLYKEGAALEEGRSLAELGVENDDELAVAYRGAGEERGAGLCCCRAAAAPSARLGWARRSAGAVAQLACVPQLLLPLLVSPPRSSTALQTASGRRRTSSTLAAAAAAAARTTERRAAPEVTASARSDLASCHLDPAACP